MESNKHNIGYVQGTFDLFHIGHLNLLRRAKERCNYLIVGVVTDELNERYKGRLPVISFDDRAEIVRAIRYTDEVIKVDIGSDNKLDIWDRYHFDCHFSGDDHTDWAMLTKELRKRGSDVEFFPYTQKVSSTKIRKDLSGLGRYGLATGYPCHLLPSRFALYGAGHLGRDLYRRLQDVPDKIVTLWADKEWEKLNAQGIGVVKPERLVQEEEKVVIAVRKEQLAMEIKQDLATIGIDDKRLLWLGF